MYGFCGCLILGFQEQSEFLFTFSLCFRRSGDEINLIKPFNVFGFLFNKF